MKLFVVLALSFPLLAADPFPGLYRLEGAREAVSELVLKPGGRFQYTLIYGAADFTAEGQWTAQPDGVTLTTDPAPPPFRLAAAVQGKQDGTRIKVQLPNGRPVQHIEVILPEGKERTDHDGFAEFPPEVKVREVRFRVTVYNVEAGPFTLDKDKNDFVFELNPQAVTRMPFEGERLKATESGLELRGQHYRKVK